MRSRSNSLRSFFLTIIKLNAIAVRGRNTIIKTIFFLVNYIFALFENLYMLVQK